MIADFSACTAATTLGGSAGAACPGTGCGGLSDLKDSYVEEPDHGCVARIEYHIAEWSAYWLKITGADFSPYNQLIFDIRADRTVGVPQSIKIEIKRPCPNQAIGCKEVAIKRVSGITEEWKTISVSLDPENLEYVSFAPQLTAFDNMDELVFTFEKNQSGAVGLVFIDNIKLK